MCTDYTDLNKTCLKDLYQLLSINQLSNGTFDCGLLSFMDAYSGTKSGSTHTMKPKSCHISSVNGQNLQRRSRPAGGSMCGGYGRQINNSRRAL
ncbi:hypothetical protein CR513_62816, partial [Mucuna pruriens]